MLQEDNIGADQRKLERKNQINQCKVVKEYQTDYSVMTDIG